MEHEEIWTPADDPNVVRADPRVVPERRKCNSGIVVFSSTRKTLYINQAAHHILSRLAQRENEHGHYCNLLRSANDLLDETLPFLRAAGMEYSCKQLNVRRLIAARDQSVLVKTFGIRNRMNIRQPLIVLTLQEQ
jgi:hypothetical protein